MRVEDQMDFIEAQCLITTSQVNTLSTTLFAREEVFSLYHDHVDPTAWPVFSDDDDDEDVVQIVFRSPPPTPEPGRLAGDAVNDGPNDGGVGVVVDLEVTGEKNTVKSCDGDGLNNGVVSGIAEELGLQGERKKAELCDGDGNDVVSEMAKKKSKLRDDDELLDLNTPGALNDGGEFPAETRNGAENDVVYGNSVELGFTGERKRAREESVSIYPPMVNETAKKLRFSDGTNAEVRENAAEGGGDTQVVNMEDDDEVTENVVECGVVLEDVEAPVIDTRQVNVTDEDDDDNDEVEEVYRKDGGAPVCDTEQVNLSDESEEDEIDTKSTFDRNSKAESSGDAMESLLEMLTLLSDRKGKEVEEVDLLETAKRRGYTFPQPRWLP